MVSFVASFLQSKFGRFAIVGVISAGIEFSLYFLFTNFINYQIANVISFALTNIFTFILSRRYVFASSNENKTEEVTLFVLCLFGALIVSQIVLSSLVEYISVNDKIAKGFAICVAVVWNFFTRKHIVFKNREEVAATEEPIVVPEPVDDSKEN